MWIKATVSSLHVLALGIGLGSVFMRGRYFRAARAKPGAKENWARLFTADNFWGVAALLWISTGLARVFGGLEKGSDFYLRSPMFHAKMGVFGILFVLELWPMVNLIRWRIAERKGRDLGRERIPLAFIRINDFEVAMIALIPLLAGAMARGIGMD